MLIDYDFNKLEAQTEANHSPKQSEDFLNMFNNTMALPDIQELEGDNEDVKDDYDDDQDDDDDEARDDQMNDNVSNKMIN